MGKIIMVTGGARSGKSTWAENKASGFGGRVLYIATALAFDGEMKDRIAKHRERRNADWQTSEAYRNLNKLIEGANEGTDAVLIDCITLLVSNIMLEKNMDWEHITQFDCELAERDVKAEVGNLLESARIASFATIIVTNELGMGVVPPSVLGRAMRDIAGRINQMVAREADEVYMCISGIPLKIKDKEAGL